jgi:tRNA modification GTPase
MFSEDTIAAIATPVGIGAIGIVRISGVRALEIADQIFRPFSGVSLKRSPSHRIYYGYIESPFDRQRIDEVLTTVMLAPKTFTKEDVVEINCHGGPVSLRQTLELILQLGARLAEPGEFTKRAFLNGRIDLIQAEAVLDVIKAKTDRASLTALKQLEGGLSKTIETLRDATLAATALVEAFIDFPEEDIDFSLLNQLMDDAQNIKTQLVSLIESSQSGRILREGLKTAIVGRPNVGKSSLLNALLGSDRAIVTDIPGTTTDVIEESINIQGFPIVFLDTAGIRQASNQIEEAGIYRTMKVMSEADLTLLVLDNGAQLTKIEQDLMAQGQNMIAVLNKCDLPITLDANQIPQSISKVRISATKGFGLDQLKSVILNQIIHSEIEGAELIVSNVRHTDALKRALNHLEHFILSLSQNLPAELIALDLREILDAFGEIIGATTAEDILDRIFSEFCIGK